MMRVVTGPESKDAYKLALLVAGVVLVSYVLSHTYDTYRILAVLIFSAMLWILYKRSGMVPDDLGLAKSRINTGLKWGAVCLLIIGAVIAASAYLVPDAFMDERYRQSLGSAVLMGLLYVPLATVFFEELVFRGYVLAFLRRRYPLKAAVVGSSLCFGLWHVFSALAARTIFGSGGTEAFATTLSGVLLVVASTTVAGVLFCMLRIRSGSIIAPVIAHWGINAFSIIAAAIVWQR